MSYTHVYSKCIVWVFTISNISHIVRNLTLLLKGTKSWLFLLVAFIHSPYGHNIIERFTRSMEEEGRRTGNVCQPVSLHLGGGQTNHYCLRGKLQSGSFVPHHSSSCFFKCSPLPQIEPVPISCH